jgi:hypothetical protein
MSGKCAALVMLSIIGGKLFAENKKHLRSSPCLVPPILPKFHYAKRRFPVTSKCRQMYGVLNIDEIKN